MENIETLIENFSFLESWEDKYQYLIDLGESLPALSDSRNMELYRLFL